MVGAEDDEGGREDVPAGREGAGLHVGITAHLLPRRNLLRHCPLSYPEIATLSAEQEREARSRGRPSLSSFIILPL